MCKRLELVASALAVAAAVVLLVADSAAPDCTEYEGLDVQYAFETDCPRSAARGVLHFQLSPDVASNWGDSNARLVEQAANAGLLLENATVQWNHLDCMGPDVGVARPAGFDLRVAPASPLAATGPGSSAAELYGCTGWDWDGELRDDQTLTCYPYVGEGEAQSCTLTLTHMTEP